VSPSPGTPPPESLEELEELEELELLDSPELPASFIPPLSPELEDEEDDPVGCAVLSPGNGKSLAGFGVPCGAVGV
jgi:hypothetical protein